MDTRASTTTTRLSLIPVVIALLMNLVIGPLAPVLQDGIADVLAAPETVVDENGANDEPGQKDLTQLTIDYAGLPASVFVSWNWDEISWSGANTGDGCALFDTDDDLNVDAAICVTITGDPAELFDVRLYECTADAKVDRCTGPSEVTGDLDSTCTVDQANTDPFANGDEHPVDTVATCTILLAEVAAGTAELVNVCSYPSEEPNSDPSDCVLIIRDGALRVIKVVTNDNGGTATCASFEFDVMPGDLGETFEGDCSNLIAVEPGVYDITEPAVAGYATTYSNCADVQIDSGETETCTITNNDIGASLTVTKVVTNDNGGTASCANFSFSVNGAASVPFEGDCSNTFPVNAGTYTVTEPVVAAGYTPSFTNCSNIMIGLGGSATCTITNNDNAPSLTLVKVVTNDNGGTLSADDWTLSASGPTPISGDGSVSSGASFDAGTYNLSEDGPDNYTASDWECVGTGTQDDSDTVSLDLGESLTCTITNDDDAPGLTLVKVVTNDNGGSAAADDWTLTATGPTGFSGTSGVSSGADFDAGQYNLSEDGPDGYDPSAWVCVGGTQDDDDTVTVGLGESVTCTITNNDQEPSLTLVKAVTNNDGGTNVAADWTLTASGPTGFSGDGDASSGADFEAGTYDLSEDGPAGYDASAWDCEGGTQEDGDTITLDLGESATCTITNDDIPATLIVEKEVIGGDLDCEDFSFVVNGGAPIAFEEDCSNSLTVDAGDYSVVEPSVDGYTTTYENCANISLGNDETATCTITNTRDTGDLEIVKDLEPSDDPGLFDLLIDSSVEKADASDGDGTGAITLETGTYEVSEEAGTGTTLSDYDSSIECIDRNDENEVVSSSDGTALFVEVTKDSDILCTISNTAIDVGIEKEHDEEDGKVEPGDVIEYEVTVSVNVGNATNVVVTDTLPDGLTYVDGSASIEPDEIDGQTLTWNLGDLDAEGSPYTITYEASVDADAAGLLKNLACLDADQNPAEICTDTSLLVQSVAVEKTNGTTGTVIPGTAVDFALTLDVTNGPIDSLILVDQLPAGLAVVDETTISDGGDYDATANTITWMLTDVEDGELLTYEAVVSATATAGAYTNVATITDGPCVGDGCDDDSTVNVRVPSLVVDKAASTETITISGPNDDLVASPSIVTWTLSWTLSSGPVTNAVISDEIPAGFEFLDASDGGQLIAGEVVWTFPTLTESGSVTFRTTVDPEAISRVAPTVNVAVIDSDETEPDEGEDSVTVVVEPPPLGGTPTPRPSMPNTAIGFGSDGTPVTIPVELLVAVFLGSLGALALANVRARSRRS